jgi:UDP-N-acetylglucosamine 2-epimerase
VGLTPERILQGLSQVAIQNTGGFRDYLMVSDYSIPNVSDKVVRIILSYAPYVKRVVWSE